MILVNNLEGETCCLHLESNFTEESEGLIENIVTWSKAHHLKLSISKSNKLVVHYSAVNMDDVAQKLQIVQFEYFTYMCYQSRRSKQLTHFQDGHKVSVFNSVLDQM